MNDHIAIIGVGLIGGSLAKALKARHADCIITGIDTDSTALEIMREEHAIDTSYHEVTAQALKACNILIIATPPSTWHALAVHLHTLPLHHIELIMDVGSIKAYAQACFAAYPQFVAAHPIAGSEFSGAAFSVAGLFNGKRLILTPAPSTDKRALQRAHQFWEALGAVVSEMPADKHDVIYANVSHLPQFVAYASAAALLPHIGYHERVIKFLRLAGSSPALWLGVFQHNPAIYHAAEHYLHIINHMIAELRTGIVHTDIPLQFDTALPLVPRIIASCLIAAVTIEERKHDMKMSTYAGSGFADTTHPAITPPEEDLAGISEHTNAVVALLEMVERRVRDMLLAIKKEDWASLHSIMQTAQREYVAKLN
jgi:prephenate dehydrogenase